MLLDGKITIANRTLAHVLVSLWKASPLTFGATERPLNFANKKPGEVFRRGFKSGGRGDVIKILGGKYSIHVDPYSLERQEEVSNARTKIGFTRKQKAQDIADSILASKLSNLYRTSVEEIVACVHASSAFVNDESFGKQLWDSLRNGIGPLRGKPLEEVTIAVLKWAFRVYSSSDPQAYIEGEGVDSWREVIGSGGFDGMAVMDFMYATSQLLGRVQNAASLAGILLHSLGLGGELVEAVEEAAFKLQMEEWVNNRLLSILIQDDVMADGRQFAITGGPNKSMHLEDWRMELVEVDDVDCYSPFDGT